MLADQSLELPHHLGMTSERQLRLDQPLQRSDPQVIETADLPLREGLEGELGQGRAAPERQRFVEHRDGPLRVAAGQLASPLGH